MRLSVLLVDDEAPARRKLKRFLEALPEVSEIHEAEDGLQAVGMIDRWAYDLVFLDIQMPELDGLAVIEAVGPEKMPLTIFTTAFDEFAVQAFELEALDYLLKPFDRERFEKAVQRALERLAGDGEGGLEKLLRRLQQGRPSPLERIVVKKEGRILLVPVEKIRWISAEDKYLKLHCGKEKHLIRATLSELEKRLDSGSFKRIHRSYLVNLGWIQEIRPWSHGDYIVVLKDETELPMSRRFSEQLLSAL